MEPAFERLVGEIRACTVCAPHLPLGPRPIVRGRPSARLLIISQAPGTQVHETGLSFNDRSGDRLRAWLALDRTTFYDETRVAVVPMGFCYPGRDGKGGDLPPRRECAPLWHARLLACFPAIELTLLVGSYAIDYYLAGSAARSMTEAIARWHDFLPKYFRPAASELAHDALAARQPVVRERGPPRVARSGYPGHQSPSSIRAMSSSLKPKWWPISWISTWRTRRARSSPVSHQ